MAIGIITIDFLAFDVKIKTLIENFSQRLTCSNFIFQCGTMRSYPAQPWYGQLEDHRHAFEICKKHPEDHTIHENGVRCQICKG